MNVSRMIGAIAVGVVLLGFGTTEALAKPICLSDGLGGYFYFAKPKIPKKPGDATSFPGAYYAGAILTAQVNLTMASNGSIVGSAVLQVPDSSTNSVMMGWTTDATLAGTGHSDKDGDFYKDDLTFTMTVVDCSTVTIP